MACISIPCYGKHFQKLFKENKEIRTLKHSILSVLQYFNTNAVKLPWHSNSCKQKSCMKSTFKVSSQAFDISSLFAAKFKFSFLYIIYHPSQSIFKYTLLNVNQCIARLPLPEKSRLKAMFKHFPNVMHCWDSFDPNYTVCPTFGPLRFFPSSSWGCCLPVFVCALLQCLSVWLGCHAAFSCILSVTIYQ